MNDFRSDLEKAIDEFASKYANDESGRYLIDNGDRSAFKEKYGIDFDVTSERWCFRSATHKEIKYSEETRDHYVYEDRIKEFDTFLMQLMEDARDAINNSLYYQNNCYSYSKYLAAPLFKYGRGDTPLIIEYLYLNSFDISLDLHCFDWIPNENRKHIEELDMVIPFKELSSKKKMLEYVYEGLWNELMDIDNVTIGIRGATLDISQIGRNKLNYFYRRNGRKQFKTRASYRTDREVLTTNRIPSYKAHIIKNTKIIQLIRLIYLLKLCFLYKEKTADFIELLLSNQYPNIVLCTNEDVAAIRWLLNYLDDGKHVMDEIGVYHDTFKHHHLPWSNGRPEGEERFFSFITYHKYIDPQFAKQVLSQIFTIDIT